MRKRQNKKAEKNNSIKETMENCENFLPPDIKRHFSPSKMADKILPLFIFLLEKNM